MVPSALADEVSMQEDNIQELGFVGFDPVMQSVYQNSNGITITQSPSNGTLGALTLTDESTGQLATWIADYTPNTDFSGTDEVKFTVTSPSGTSSEGIITITVNPVNDLPVLNDIANVALFLASDLSSYITGQTIRVSGGM